MDKLKKIKYYIDSLCIYDLKSDSIIRAIYNLANSVDSEAILTGQSEFFRIVTKNNSLKEYISRCILTDDNPFTRAACAGNVDKLEKSVIDAVKLDLVKLEEISSLTADDLAHFVTDEDLKEILKTIPAWETGKPLAPLTVNWGEQIQELIAYHKTNGYGEYAKHIAFTWRNKEICPVTSADLITLADLKTMRNSAER